VYRTPIEEVPEPRQDDVNANAHHQAIVKFASDQKLNEGSLSLLFFFFFFFLIA
jgi:hypothetical protein